MRGELVGGGGGVEGILSVVGIKERVIGGRIKVERGDEECDVDYVGNEGGCKEVEVGVSK